MDIKNDTRLPEYMYWNQLLDHLGGDASRLFGNDFIWPRQFEIHLPGNHKEPCQLACPHCAGSLFDKSLGNWETPALELLDKLAGAIPYHIYGGAYTEPLINPYFMAFLAMTKKHGNHFGIHTSGVGLLQLEESQGWLTELNRISTDKTDYLSVSLDAGFPWSWAKTKGIDKGEIFNDIIRALRLAVKIREKREQGHAIRLCYLISPASDSPENFGAIVNIAREIGVDSLRFSIPFANYNQSFDTVRKYKANREIPGDALYRERLAPYLSTSMDDKTYVFYTGPEFTDVDSFTFKKCYYGYYQITYGADGYCYKCSTTATPTAKHCRLGKITPDLDEFKSMIIKNQQGEWSCKGMCFDRGLRCNRMGAEINTKAQELMEKSEQ